MEIKVNKTHKGVEIKNTPEHEETKWCIACCGSFSEWYEERGYRNLIFEGTKKEVEEFIDELCREEDDLKVTGYFEYNSKEYYHFLHGPLWKELI